MPLFQQLWKGLDTSSGVSGAHSITAVMAGLLTGLLAGLVAFALALLCMDSRIRRGHPERNSTLLALICSISSAIGVFVGTICGIISLFGMKAGAYAVLIAASLMPCVYKLLS